jgi:putative transposase
LGAAQDRRQLKARQPESDWPAASTAGDILKRAGLACARRLRRRAPPRLGELTQPQYANYVWNVDHKGWIRLGDGSRVEPLTMTDGFSRYLVSVSATVSGLTALSAWWIKLGIRHERIDPGPPQQNGRLRTLPSHGSGGDDAARTGPGGPAAPVRPFRPRL